MFLRDSNLSKTSPRSDKLAIQLACCSVTIKVAALALKTALTCSCCSEAIAGEV